MMSGLFSIFSAASMLFFLARKILVTWWSQVPSEVAKDALGDCGSNLCDIPRLSPHFVLLASSCVRKISIRNHRSHSQSNFWRPRAVRSLLLNQCLSNTLLLSKPSLPRELGWLPQGASTRAKPVTEARRAQFQPPFRSKQPSVMSYQRHGPRREWTRLHSLYSFSPPEHRR